MFGSDDSCYCNGPRAQQRDINRSKPSALRTQTIDDVSPRQESEALSHDISPHPSSVGSPGVASEEGSIAATSPPPQVELELFSNRFAAITAEMGEMLQRTALSTNVRERLDFSCALLDADGQLVINAPHIPVHLGALGLCVRRLREAVTMAPGDAVVSNHPGYGGSHLPDVTVVHPVFSEATGDDIEGRQLPGHRELLGYVASRAHHAEIGGCRPGSMPPDGRCLADEGVVIRPRHLVQGGEAQWAELRRVLGSGPYPSRAVAENLADLDAALAANQRGVDALQNLARRTSTATVQHFMAALRRQAAERCGAALQRLGQRHFEARQELDDGTPIQVHIAVADGRAHFDFSGSGGVHPGNLNATPAIVQSAVLYVLRLLLDEPLPLNEGLMEPVTLQVPPDCFLAPHFDDDPRRAPAVVGGNVETSQRLVDTLLLAFGLAACSQGTMNNVLFGDATFGYYETVCGGSGAGPTWHGTSAVHSHMTNTRITDSEVLEHRFPVRLERFEIRHGSGGRGRYHGGDGVVRELHFLQPVALSLLSQHRRVAPYGMAGGGDGAVGEQHILRRDGSRQDLEGMDRAELQAGDRLVLATPGGGAWGREEP